MGKRNLPQRFDGVFHNPLVIPDQKLFFPLHVREPTVHKFAWRGQVMPLPFTVRVPADFRPGELVGIVSVELGNEAVINCEFRVLIGRKT